MSSFFFFLYDPIPIQKKFKYDLVLITSFFFQFPLTFQKKKINKQMTFKSNYWYIKLINF